MKSIFPDSMLSSSGGELTLESVAAKFDYFFSQLHLLHMQTGSFAEHEMLNLYAEMPGDKDEILEKLMGYTGRRVRAYKLLPITDNVVPSSLLQELKAFAKELKTYAEANGYQDIANLSDTLSGKAAKALFLSTLS